VSLVILDRMWKQADIAKQESDTAYFYSLTYLGEMVLKITAAGLIAAIEDDRDRHRYRQLHRLVRADGLGEWSSALDDVLTGPASQYLLAAARVEQKELTQNCKDPSWQYEVVRLLTICLKEIDPSTEGLPDKVSARKLFTLLVQLRNETRAHGAPQLRICSRVSPALERALKLFCTSHSLFKRPWAFLHRNLSGTYRVTKLSDDVSPFIPLKSDPSPQWDEGVYIHFDTHRRVELIASDPDSSDFYFPNGAFNGKNFEMLSYLSGTKVSGACGPYLVPATALPPSETQGMGDLDIQGRVFGNLPPVQSGYVHRLALESELYARLLDDRHPVITLAGSGGIGKTSLAISVLHQIANDTRYEAILWFSARDIDLLGEGPRMVQPRVLTESEIAKEFVRMLDPAAAKNAGFKAAEYLAGALSKSPLGAPILFVFDNFETVRNPSELYTWTDTYVRSPNKILITTRVRDFKGDYPVDVFGMTESECRQLIDDTAFHLNIRKLLTEEYKQQLIRETEGHPYAIKILLGEVAKAGKLQKVERIISGRSEVLEALFERTFASLSPAAKHVFLTLASWRSVVPQLAVEAIMLRPSNERFDVDAAITELKRSSFIETAEAKDGTIFLYVPLVAAIFGKGKLAVSPLKTTIEANTEFLRMLGAAQKTDLQHGIGPRIRTMFGRIAASSAKEGKTLDEYLPIMEFVARGYPPAWQLISQLHEESAQEDSNSKAKEAILRFLQVNPKSEEKRAAWKKLSELCGISGDWMGEIHALVEMCEIPGTAFIDISNSANRLNNLLHHYQFIGMDEKPILVRRLADLMNDRIGEGDSTDCSRLAWLYLHLNDSRRASELAEAGLRMEPRDEHCLKIKRRLAEGPRSASSW
jgi:NB-ARC domain-containing protein